MAFEHGVSMKIWMKTGLPKTDLIDLSIILWSLFLSPILMIFYFYQFEQNKIRPIRKSVYKLRVSEPQWIHLSIGLGYVKRRCGHISSETCCWFPIGKPWIWLNNCILPLHFSKKKHELNWVSLSQWYHNHACRFCDCVYGISPKCHRIFVVVTKIKPFALVYVVSALVRVCLPFSSGHDGF